MAGGRPIRVRVQLSEAEHEALQSRAKAQGTGIPQVLVDAALNPKETALRAGNNELAGVRRILADEAHQLKRIADNAARTRWDQDAWDEAAKGIAWRNEKLTERFGW